jgi:hypothetical protein
MTSRGRVYTDAQKQAITDWLAQEVIERGGGGGGGGPEGPGQATARLLNQWTACMTLANWQAANMTTAWGNMQTNGGSACRSCHATGGQGFIATNIEETAAGGPPGMWTVVSTKEPYLVQFFSVDLASTPAKVIMNMTTFQGVATGTPPHSEHPRFDPANNDGMNALKTFYDTTAAGLGACMATGTKLAPPA